MTVIRTIGSVWDGNEVWLIAGGGTLHFAFPLPYAFSFRGFYLPLNIVLWLLMLRGIGIEFRMDIENHVWRSLFDGFFAIIERVAGDILRCARQRGARRPFGSGSFLL